MRAVYTQSWPSRRHQEHVILATHAVVVADAPVQYQYYISQITNHTGKKSIELLLFVV